MNPTPATTECFRSRNFQGVLAGCLSDWSSWRWSILADVLRDEFLAEEICQEAAYPIAFLTPWDIWSFGIGRGRGSGIGRGSGSGSGIGIGRGIGSGSGSGSGSGIGIGSGSGIGIGIINYEVRQMEIGQAYLFFCGDWHAFVGRVVAQVGPFTYRLEQVSKVHDTHGNDNWELLAAGDKAARKAAEYRHYTTGFCLPLSIAATDWVGKLPQEGL